jgi:uncharacterized membrane protein YeaQ/YmgE (transglycosylase-associated protein family)
VSTPSLPGPESSGQSASGTAGDTSGEQSSAESGIDRLKAIGGLIALVAGLLALIIVVIVALIVKPDTTGGAIATSAIGVIGSTVGAYFGVKVGTDGTQKAIQAQQQEATKAQAFALHTAPADADEAIAHATALIESQKTLPNR